MAPQVLGSIFLHRESSASAAPSVTSALDDSARESSFPTPGSSAHSAPAAVGAGLASGSAGPMGVSSSNGMYDAVKADIYSLGAILMFLLFKEVRSPGAGLLHGPFACGLRPCGPRPRSDTGAWVLIALKIARRQQHCVVNITEMAAAT
jgi:hypothetical protein